MKNKYKQLSSISDESFPRIKKIFINNFKDEWDVIFVTNDDMVYGFGDNIFAILVMKTSTKVSNPTLIEELCEKDIKKVVFGEMFMVALTESNKLYTGGWCLYGRCGNGVNNYSYSKPRKIMTKSLVVVDIRCGRHYTVLLTDKQQVFTFGSISEDANNQILSPTLISVFQGEKITSISCGFDHALALSQTGKVYAWGCNLLGELGLNENKYERKPKLIEMTKKVSVKQISCGNSFSLLLTNEGNIYSFGYNYHGQLGHNHTNNVKIPTLISTKSKFTEILAFGLQSFALNESNGIEFWGQNIVGEDVLSPQPTNLCSLQDVIILKMKYPFTIQLILCKKQIENSDELLIE